MNINSTFTDTSQILRRKLTKYWGVGFFEALSNLICKKVCTMCPSLHSSQGSQTFFKYSNKVYFSFSWIFCIEGCCCASLTLFIISDPSRVVYTPTIQYLPLHLSGIIQCHIESHPPFQFITWTKDKRIFDPFEMEEIQTLTNGSLLITKVRKYFNFDICSQS